MFLFILRFCFEISGLDEWVRLELIVYVYMCFLCVDLCVLFVSNVVFMDFGGGEIEGCGFLKI